MGIFSSPSVVKGYLTIPADQYDGVGEQALIFHFNPTKLKDTHPPRWGSNKMPGQAHPVYQYGGAEDRVISFTLRLDGDRGRANVTSSVSGTRKRMGGRNRLLDLLKSQSALVVSQGSLRTGVGFIKSANKVVGGNLNYVQQLNPPISQSETYSSELGPGDPAGLNINTELDFFRRFSYPGSDGRFATPPPRVLFSLGSSYQGIECIVHVKHIEIFMWTPDMEPVRADVDLELKEFARVPQFRSNVITVG